MDFQNLVIIMKMATFQLLRTSDVKNIDLIIDTETST